MKRLMAITVLFTQQECVDSADFNRADDCQSANMSVCLNGDDERRLRGVF